MTGRCELVSGCTFGFFVFISLSFIFVFHQPSPPMSEVSSPGAEGLSPAGAMQVQRPVPSRSPYEWMKKPSYQNQSNPGKCLRIQPTRCFELKVPEHFSKQIIKSKKRDGAKKAARTRTRSLFVYVSVSNLSLPFRH